MNIQPPKDMEHTLKYLIRESEIEIRNCQKLIKEYEGNLELTHMYTLKMLHYEFMICRLRRHLTESVTPKTWCDKDEPEVIDV